MKLLTEQNILILLILVLVGVVVYRIYTMYAGFKFDNADYQYGRPNMENENYYYQCLKEECNDDTHDFDCLEKCHTKTFKKGEKTIDHADWQCMRYRDNEDDYYRCLDWMYSDGRIS